MNEKMYKTGCRKHLALQGFKPFITDQ